MTPVVSNILKAAIVFAALATTLSVAYCEQQRLKEPRAIQRVADILHEVGKNDK